jgi:PAS domain S-box-containing protein
MRTYGFQHANGLEPTNRTFARMEYPMDEKDMARTVRLDIHPDFVGEYLARKKEIRRTKEREAGKEPAWFPKTIIQRISSALGADERSGDFQKLLQSIYDAVLITDLTGTVLDFNQRALDFFLCEDLAGIHVTDLIAGADTHELFATIEQSMRSHRYMLIDAECVRNDGSGFPAEIAVNRMDLENTGQYSFFIRDVSERKRQQAVLEDAITRLEEHDRAKSLFVSNVSHELKTPLTSMIYAVANLLRGVAGSVPDRIRRYLELMDGDCKRMLGTVNDILDLRKIDDKTLVLNKTRIPFGRLVSRTVKALEVQVEQKFLKMNIATGAGKWFVELDALKFERVVLNLVHNAIKFTPDSGQIDVLVQDDPKRIGCVQLVVRDNGVGIPPEAVDRVTERYFTVGEQPCGSGLGLAISKEIIELHGGSLTVFSPPPHREQGTQVVATLPIVPPPQVLVVDDDPATLELLVRQMEWHGYRVLKASDGAEAFETVLRTRPDAVILDMVLPKMEGTEVILKMKADKNVRHIPIIVITGAHVGRGKAEILNSFSIPALMKPWQEVDLLDRVEEAFLGAATINRWENKA